MGDVQSFKSALGLYKPTTSRDVNDNLYRIAELKMRRSRERLNLVQHQIAFSRSGLRKLGLTDPTRDDHFDSGPMINEKEVLGDTQEWDPVFNDGKVDGVFVVAGESRCR